MTPDRIAEVQAEIDRLIPDGFSVLYRLRRDRTCSPREWEDLREFYAERVQEFYEVYAPVWDGIPVGERIAICRAFYCHRTSGELAAQEWGSLPISAKRLIWRSLPVATAGN